LSGLKTALTSTKPAVPAEVQAKFDSALKALTPAMDAAFDKNAIDATLASRVKQMAAELKQLAATPLAAAGP
jgi:hypothetical protein